MTTRLSKAETRILEQFGPPESDRLDWRGKSNHRQPDTVLAPFFADMTSRAVSGQKALEMHFEQLEFFNSSTIRLYCSTVKR